MIHFLSGHFLSVTNRFLVITRTTFNINHEIHKDLKDILEVHVVHSLLNPPGIANFSEIFLMIMPWS